MPTSQTETVTPQEAIERLKTLYPLVMGHNGDKVLDLAIATIEATIPRMLMVEELRGMLPMAVWIEHRNEGSAFTEMRIIKRRINHELRFDDLGWQPVSAYGFDYRLWTHKPTTEQMATTPWED
jgi:hypothetical protein